MMRHIFPLETIYLPRLIVAASTLVFTVFSVDLLRSVLKPQAPNDCLDLLQQRVDETSRSAAAV